MKGIIFFGHGAKDIQWREPFDKLVQLWQEAMPNAPVELAFLERMNPDLLGAIELLLAKGVDEIQVVPVFFGQGGHLREDFPLLLKEAGEKFPNTTLSATPAVGECVDVLQAIIGYAKSTL